MAIVKSISVSVEFDNLQKEYKISWTEAARRGMALMLAERGVRPYDSDLNLLRRIQEREAAIEKLNGIIMENSSELENSQKELQELKERLPKDEQ